MEDGKSYHKALYLFASYCEGSQKQLQAVNVFWSQQGLPFRPWPVLYEYIHLVMRYRGRDVRLLLSRVPDRSRLPVSFYLPPSHLTMRLLHIVATLLIVSESPRCRSSSVDIEANLDLKEAIPGYGNGTNDSVPDITIRIKAVIEPPKTESLSNLPSHTVPSLESGGSASTIAPPRLLLPSDWKASASPSMTAGVPGGVTGWNSTLLNFTAARPTSFTGGATVVSRSWAYISDLHILLAFLILAEVHGIH